ncbi:MAG TPA: CDP-alcohol phosphatidyltransferase family protein [Isosphaeraceae bacterium]|nr:CDP-alcohol phosphatidyltransferase family protein [Isosphaeraceae bacterium]
MPRPSPPLVIDARPRGPAGPLAGERVLGRCVLAHLLDLALALGDGPVAIHARLEEHRWLRDLVADRPASRFVFLTGPPSEGSAILRTDRLYDPARLRRALRRGRAPESAEIWRLDRPHGLAGAEAELTRRRSYQPLGRHWALGPARRLARRLCPTRVRPNALTLASASLMLGASAAVAFAPAGVTVRALSTSALALALVLDTADGHLARLQGTASEFGRWLDAVLDELGDMALHAAIAWAAFARDARPAWLVLGMVYAMGKYVFLVGATSGRGEGGQERVPIGHPHLAVTPTPLPSPPPDSPLMAVVRLAGHADVRWHLWIILAALGRLDAALAAYAAYYPARALSGAVRKVVRHG